jgi:hypothetical protein
MMREELKKRCDNTLIRHLLEGTDKYARILKKTGVPPEV